MGSLTLFDDLAVGYEDWFGSKLGAFVDRRETGFLLRLLQLKPGERILELGSGTGHFARAVSRSGAACVGIDPSVEMLRVAAARGDRDVGYVRGRGEALPFSDRAFDGVLCMTTLEFVQDIPATIREAARVVRPGGRLVFGVLNADGPWARARQREGGLWLEARFFRAPELRELLAPLGEPEIDSCVHVPPGASGLPAPLLAPVDWIMRHVAPGGGALIGARITLGGTT